MAKPAYPPPPPGSKVDWQDREKWNQWDWGPWSRAAAPYALAIMLQRAREGRPITYEDLDKRLRRYKFKEQPRKEKYGKPIGLVGHVLEDLRERSGKAVPPLNVIVINKYKKVPGDGADELARNYFRSTGKRFDKRQRRAFMRQAIADVINYGHQWLSVASDLGVELLPINKGKVGRGRAIALPKLPKSYEGESKEHKALKQWVLENPDRFKRYGKFKTGKAEHQLSSGDRVDVHFANGNRRLAVEVKPSHASNEEMKRGIYQVIKYRAVMQAEQLSLNLAPIAEAVLVSVNHPTGAVRELLDRFKVMHITAPIEAEGP